MRTTPIEQVLINELVKLKIPHEPQKAVGWNPPYCRSKYPCKCGLGWSDPDTGESYEEDAYEYPENCNWLSQGYYNYYIDIFIPLNRGFAIEIDDKASHSSKYQIKKDKDREIDIIGFLDCKFIRFKAKKIYNDLGGCVRKIQEKVMTEEEIIKTIDVEYMPKIDNIKNIFNGKIIGHA